VNFLYSIDAANAIKQDMPLWNLMINIHVCMYVCMYVRTPNQIFAGARLAAVSFVTIATLLLTERALDDLKRVGTLGTVFTGIRGPSKFVTLTIWVASEWR
jgi:hypothetical protein